jgi:hypothetical protein
MVQLLNICNFSILQWDCLFLQNYHIVSLDKKLLGETKKNFDIEQKLHENFVDMTEKIIKKIEAIHR